MLEKPPKTIIGCNSISAEGRKGGVPGLVQVMSYYHIFRTKRHTYVLEEENRKKKFEAKNVVKYLITSFKAEIL